MYVCMHDWASDSVAFLYVVAFFKDFFNYTRALYGTSRWYSADFVLLYFSTSIHLSCPPSLSLSDWRMLSITNKYVIHA